MKALSGALSRVHGQWVNQRRRVRESVSSSTWGWLSSSSSTPSFRLSGQEVLKAIQKEQSPNTAEQEGLMAFQQLVLGYWIVDTSMDVTLTPQVNLQGTYDVVTPDDTTLSGFLCREAGKVFSVQIPRRLCSSKAYMVLNAQHVAFFNEITSKGPLLDLESHSCIVRPVSGAPLRLEVMQKNGLTSSSMVIQAQNPQEVKAWVDAFKECGFVVEANDGGGGFYPLVDKDIKGHVIKMDAYAGKVCLVVNVASNCGLTKLNYTQLVELDKKYREKGLVILAFPCNQFGGQEPGTNEEIMDFVAKFGVQFQMFEKADVNGPKARAVFVYLKDALPGSFGNFIKWNFTKFLVDRHGKPVARYGPNDAPFTFEKRIEQLLAESA